MRHAEEIEDAHRGAQPTGGDDCALPGAQVADEVVGLVDDRLSPSGSRPDRPSAVGLVSRILPRDLTATLSEWCASAGIAEYPAQVAAAAVLAGALTDSAEALVTVTAPGSSARFPLRVALGTGATSFRDLATRVAEAMLSGAPLAGMPDAGLPGVADLDPTTDPLTPIAVVPAGEPSALAARTGRAAAWEIGVGPDAATLTFDSATVADLDAALFLDRYVHLLGELVRADRLAEADLLLPQERSLLLGWGAGPEADPVAATTVAELVLAAGRRHPDKVAVIDETGSMTYAELDAWSAGAARALVEAGVEQGDLLGACLPRDRFLPAGLLAIWRAGAAYVPLDPDAPIARIRELAAGTAFVVTRAATVAVATAAVGTAALDLDLIQGGVAAAGSEPIDHARADDLAYLLFTSGSTGQPKGVEVSHANVLAFSTAQYSAPGVDAEDRNIAAAPLLFDTSVEELWTLLGLGATVVVASREATLDGHRLAALVDSAAATLVHLTPTSLRMLLAAGWEGRTRPRVWAGGETLDPALASEVLARSSQVWNTYGPTETTVTALAHRVDESDLEAGRIPLGRPIDGVSVFVVDRFGRLALPGVTGELWIAGTGVARGYRDRPDATSAAFVANPWGPGQCYRTGDRVRWNADGEVEFHGRADDQVKLRGIRIELGEVEAAVRRCPGVTDAAVVVAGTGAHAALAAYVTPAGLDLAEVADALSTLLPAALVPARWLALDQLPVTATGKVDRRGLPPIPVTAATADPLTTPTEIALGPVWRDVLGLSAVGRQDDFFRLGGTSLSATLVVARLRAEGYGTVSVADIFANPTLSALAAHLSPARVSDPALATLHPRPPEMPAPLSAAQQRAWFEAELGHDNGANNAPTVLRLRGPLDVAAMRTALGGLVDRHHLLRSTIASGPEPTWQLRDPSAVPLTESTVTPDGLADGLARFTAAPFDLTREPPLRLHLFTIEDQATAEPDHVLVLALHHMATDAASEELLRSELAAGYAAATGAGPDVPRPRLQYGDYAYAERHGDTDATGLEWWADELAGAPQLLDLPTDRPRPAEAEWTADHVVTQLNPTLTTAVSEVAQQCSTTPAMVLLTAWQLTLGFLTDSDDLLVGLPASVRTQAGTADLIGYFVNTVAVRARLDQGATGVQAIRDVTGAAHAALDHAAVPFEQVVERVAEGRSLATTPLIQTLFNVLDAPGPDPWRGLGLQTETIATPEAQAQVDLACDIIPAADALTVRLTFRQDLWSAATIAGWLAMFTRCLTELTASPHMRVGDHRLVTEQDQGTVLAWGHGPELPGLIETVPAAIARHATARPTATAVTCEDVRVRYGDLAGGARRLADLLAAQGIAAGDLVGVALPRDARLPGVLLGVWLAGAAYVPIDPDWPGARIAAVAADSGAVVILARGTGLADGGGADDGVLDGVRLLDLDALEIGVEAAVDASVGAPADGDRPVPSPSDLAYVLYTSGSTGLPKGVEVTHGNLSALAVAMAEVSHFGPDSSLLALAPLTFDVSASELWTCLAAGGRLEVVDRDTARDGFALAERIGRSGVDTVDLPATTMRMLLAAGWQGDPRLRVWTGGEALDAPLAAQVLPVVRELWNFYGPTEATISSTGDRVLRTDVQAGVITIGKPLPGERAYVVDRGGRLTPPGVAGELWLGGAGVARGYRGRPDLTAAAFGPDPWTDGRCYRTGDLARWRDGRLEFLGRRDHQVKVRGYRVELGEVESILREFAAVAETAVVVARGAGDERLVAYVEWTAMPDLAGLHAHAAANLPQHAVPHQVIELERLPLTASGKIDRTSLPDPVGGDQSAWVPPADGMEQLVANVWQGVLSRDRIGANDNFFAIGGHSLAATRAVGMLGELLDVRIPVRTLFAHPVLRSFAAAVEADLLQQFSSEDDATLESESAP